MSCMISTTTALVLLTVDLLVYSIAAAVGVPFCVVSARRLISWEAMPLLL
jgi:hypothetical protein